MGGAKSKDKAPSLTDAQLDEREAIRTVFSVQKWTEFLQDECPDDPDLEAVLSGDLDEFCDVETLWRELLAWLKHPEPLPDGRNSQCVLREDSECSFEVSNIRALGFPCSKKQKGCINTQYTVDHEARYLRSLMRLDGKTDLVDFSLRLHEHPLEVECWEREVGKGRKDGLGERIEELKAWHTHMIKDEHPDSEHRDWVKDSSKSPSGKWDGLSVCTCNLIDVLTHKQVMDGLKRVWREWPDRFPDTRKWIPYAECTIEEGNENTWTFVHAASGRGETVKFSAVTSEVTTEKWHLENGERKFKGGSYWFVTGDNERERDNVVIELISNKDSPDTALDKMALCIWLFAVLRLLLLAEKPGYFPAVPLDEEKGDSVMVKGSWSYFVGPRAMHKHFIKEPDVYAPDNQAGLQGLGYKRHDEYFHRLVELMQTNRVIRGNPLYKHSGKVEEKLGPDGIESWTMHFVLDGKILEEAGVSTDGQADMHVWREYFVDRERRVIQFQGYGPDRKPSGGLSSIKLWGPLWEFWEDPTPPRFVGHTTMGFSHYAINSVLDKICRANGVEPPSGSRCCSACAKRKKD